MMNKWIIAACMIGSLFLAGCSDDEPPPAQMSEDNVFKPQVDSLQKAQNVEDTIQSSFDQRGKQVE